MENIKDNMVLSSLIESMKNDKKAIWRRVAKELSRPRKFRVEVNLSKIDMFAEDGATVVVPGKVLGAGELTKKVTIAAFSFSDSAKKLIGAAGGKMLSLDGLQKSNPDGKGVVILK